LLDSAITKPPTGAGDAISTVAVVVFPPTTLAGFSVKRERPGAVTETLAVFETPSKDAVTVTFVLLVTATVMMSTVAVV
jgi:hypothetical protein